MKTVCCQVFFPCSALTFFQQLCNETSMIVGLKALIADTSDRNSSPIRATSTGLPYLAATLCSVKAWQTCHLVQIFLLQFKVFNPCRDIGIVHLDILDKAISGDGFQRFVQGLLPRMNKWLLPKSVLIVDNAAIHKSPASARWSKNTAHTWSIFPCILPTST
jgi:hypothetical protein